MVAKKFEFLEHTADAKFLAYGKTLEEAFANAAIATFEVMTETKRIRPRIEKQIKVSAKKKETLLYEFIEQLLYFIDTEAFLLNKVKTLAITKAKDIWTLRATVVGDNAAQYDVKTQIKAVTYNDMFIKEDKNKVTIQVVLDI